MRLCCGEGGYSRITLLCAGLAAGSIIRRRRKNRRNRRYYDLIRPRSIVPALYLLGSHSVLSSHTQHEAIFYIPAASKHSICPLCKCSLIILLARAALAHASALSVSSMSAPPGALDCPLNTLASPILGSTHSIMCEFDA